MSHFKQFSTSEGLERFDVYRVARRVALQSYRICDSFPRGHSDLSKQLRRSSKSILLNIAEGIDRDAAGDKRRAFAIARGESIESSAALDLARMLTIADVEAIEATLRDLDRVCAMLSALIRRWRE